MEQFIDPEIMRGVGHWEEYVWVPARSWKDL
jgi:hypothetical protein